MASFFVQQNDDGSQTRRAITLAATYAFGGASVDQKIQLLDAQGGGIEIDATSGSFTGSSAFKVTAPTGNMHYDPTVARLILSKTTVGGIALPFILDNTDTSAGAGVGLRFTANGTRTGDISFTPNGNLAISAADAPTGPKQFILGSASRTPLVIDLTNGDTVLANAPSQPPTNTTSGFVWLPELQGPPTGVPALTAPLSRPIVYDAINARLYSYNAGAWHYAAFNDGISSGVTLTANQVGFGSISSTLTGSANFTYGGAATDELVLLTNQAATIAPLLRLENQASAVSGVRIDFATAGSQLATIFAANVSSANALNIKLSANTSGDQVIIARDLTPDIAFIVFTGDQDVHAGSRLAVATNSTTGFVWLPTSAGSPTGAPAHAGTTARAATEIDTTNNRWYAYYGGSWHYAEFGNGIATTAILANTQIGFGSGGNTLTGEAALTYTDVSTAPTVFIGDGSASTSGRIVLNNTGNASNSVIFRKAGANVLLQSVARDDTASTGFASAQFNLTPTTGGSSKDFFRFGLNSSASGHLLVLPVLGDVALGGLGSSGGDEIGTGATSGFVYLPRMNGAPTGVPLMDGVNTNGPRQRQATVIDRGNHRWYYYDTTSTAWRYAEFNNGLASSVTLAATQIGYGNVSNVMTSDNTFWRDAANNAVIAGFTTNPIAPNSVAHFGKTMATDVYVLATNDGNAVNSRANFIAIAGSHNGSAGSLMSLGSSPPTSTFTGVIAPNVGYVWMTPQGTGTAGALVVLNDGSRSGNDILLATGPVTNTRLKIFNAGQVQIPNLATAATTFVTADSTGQLGTQAIPIPSADVSLTATQIGFGSVSNTLTSSTKFTYTDTGISSAPQLTLGDGSTTDGGNIIIDSSATSTVANTIRFRRAGSTFLLIGSNRQVSPTLEGTLAEVRVIPVVGGSGNDSWRVDASATLKGMIQAFATGDVAIGGGTDQGSELATNATQGFVYLPRMAGAPSGAPSRLGSPDLYSGIGNREAVVIDKTNKRWYWYDTAGAAWHYAVFNDGVSAATTLTAGQVGFGSASNLLTGNGQLTFDLTTFGSAVPQLIVGDGTSSTNGHIILANTGTFANRIRFANGGTAIGNVFAEINMSKDPTGGTGRIIAQTNLIPVAGGSGNDYWSIHHNSTVNNPIHAYVSKYDVSIGSPVALATGAVNGFVFLPRVTGAPTGVPDRLGIAAETIDRYPVVIDSTNKRWYYYDGAGAVWRYTEFDNGIASATTLTTTQVGFGSGGNLLTGSANFTYDGNALTISRSGGGSTLILNRAATAGTGIGTNFQFQISGTQKALVSAVQQADGTQLMAFAGPPGTGSALHFWLNDHDTVLAHPDTQLATNATAGWPWIPQTQGAPTGTPARAATESLSRPIVIDETDSRFYAYINGAWHYIVFDDGIGGSVTLPSTEIGFGSASNLLTGNANLAWDNTNKILKIGSPSTVTAAQDIIRANLDVDAIAWVFTGTNPSVVSDGNGATGIRLFAGSQTGASGSKLEITLNGPNNDSPGELDMIKTGTTGTWVFSNAANGGIDFSTNGHASVISMFATGQVSMSSLTNGLVKTTSGVLANASAADIAAAQVWPTATQVLVSSGTTTAPVGDAHFVYDTTAHNLSFLTGSTWMHNRADGTNFERVRAQWGTSPVDATPNTWFIQSEAGGTGTTVRDIAISADTARVGLVGSRVNLYAKDSNVRMSASAESGIEGLSFFTSFTRATSTSMVLDALTFAGIQYFSATNNVTTATGVNFIRIRQPEYNGLLTTPKTFDLGATVYIENSPFAHNGVNLTKGYALWIDDGATRFDGSVDAGVSGGYLAVNGANPPSNVALIVGKVVGSGRDHVQFFLSGDGTVDTDNAYFDISVGNQAIASPSFGILATQRIRNMTYSRSGGSPACTEATTLYIDGAPTLTSVTGSSFALHVAGGTTQLDGDAILAGASSQLGFFGTSPSPKFTVGGSRGGIAALGSLISILASYGLLTDGSSP